MSSMEGRPSPPKKPTPRQISRAKEKREQALKSIRKEKRRMLAGSLTAILFAVLWLVAISTDHWHYVLQGDHGNHTNTFVSSNAGLWRSCTSLRNNQTNLIQDVCEYHALFPSREEVSKAPGLDKHVIDYNRTAISMSLISVLVMLMALVAAFYTFKNARYMFKRLAAALYFVTVFCILVVMEVYITCLRFSEANLPSVHPPGSTTTYGPSFYLGWAVFLVYLLNAALFTVYSRKRKGGLFQPDQSDQQFIT